MAILSAGKTFWCISNILYRLRHSTMLPFCRMFQNGGVVMAKRSFPLPNVYKLLEPGPVVMVTTARKGQANIMSMTWFTMMEFTPPLVGAVISGNNYSFDALVATKECVINIPTADMAKTVVKVGSVSGDKVDKFAKFGLTPKPATQVQAPLIASAHACMECRIQSRFPAGDRTVYVAEVVALHYDPSHPPVVHYWHKVYQVDWEAIGSRSGATARARVRIGGAPSIISWVAPWIALPPGDDAWRSSRGASS